MLRDAAGFLGFSLACRRPGAWATQVLMPEPPR
jgi:hypothetical protein